MGIEMNNQTWGFVDKKYSREQDNIGMINFAKAYLYHLRKSIRMLFSAEELIINNYFCTYL